MTHLILFTYFVALSNVATSDLSNGWAIASVAMVTLATEAMIIIGVKL